MSGSRFGCSFPAPVVSIPRPQIRAPVGCVVCYGEFEPPEGPPTPACTHPPNVCTECLQRTIRTALKDGAYFSAIRCPVVGCRHRLEYVDVHRWASSEVFNRYDNLLMKDCLRMGGEPFVWCVNPRCGAGQEHAGGEQSNIVTCHHCGTKQCFRHQVLWHDGQTCEQWEEQRAITNQQEVMTYEWMQVETKPCPGPSCGRRIQKYDGCDHVTCRRPGGCGHRFCWQCLAPWSQIIVSDNSRHYDNCRYYSGLPGDNPAPPEIVPDPDLMLPSPTSSRSEEEMDLDNH